MKNRIILLGLLGFLFVMFIPITSYAVSINFDNVADGTVINNTYASQGVTFTSSCTACHGEVYALNSPNARSTSNVVSVYPDTVHYTSTGSFPEDDGVITATFSCRPTHVTLWALPDDDEASAFLYAYDSSDNEIDSYISAGFNSTNELMTVNAPPGQSIAYVRFAGQSEDLVAFDDLTFTGGTCDAHAAAVPTMSEWGTIIFIVLSGLGAVYYLRRKKSLES
jgi:hypothetical protein